MALSFESAPSNQNTPATATPDPIPKGTALGHVPAQDEILKNTFANHAFENFEIAAYTSLLTIADAAGQGTHRTALEQSLKEEQGMAKKVADLIQPTTQRYLELSATGEKADR